MRFTNDSFISSNDSSIEEFSVLIDDTNCSVMSEIAAIIESGLSTGTFDESPCFLESSIVISTGFCLSTFQRRFFLEILLDLVVFVIDNDFFFILQVNSVRIALFHIHDRLEQRREMPW